jgi:5-methylcytosine-specific restriction enzyme A
VCQGSIREERDGEEMPLKPKRPCAYPGCPSLSHGYYCLDHERKVEMEYNKKRGSASKQAYGVQWRRARKRYLAEHPLCVMCLKEEKVVPATVVDHVIAHKGDMGLFWDKNNWQALCKRCHDTKTAKVDGRWKRRVDDYDKNIRK